MPRNLFQNADEADATRFVRVAVELGIDALDADDAGLAYSTDAPIAVGERVDVPLGRAGQVSGVVIAAGGRELLGRLAPSRIKPIAGRAGGRVPEPLLELAFWMAQYYVCPLGMVLASMLPAAVKRAIGQRERAVIDWTELGRATEEIAGPPTAREAWSLLRSLDADPLPLGPKELALHLGLRSVGPLNRLIAQGLLQMRTVSEVRVGDSHRAEALALEGVDRAVEPTVAQQEAIDGICESLGRFSPHLIRGVTGSGKTEVYLRVIERTLRAGRGALVLVPEIALTPQTSARFLARFRDAGVAVLHSGLTQSARNHEWSRVERGEARVVVGARSAVFAPIADLGVIVVDEEHDSSYKQDQLPRYHARDVAIKRAQIEQIPVVLGSATPSLESYANTRRGRSTLWTLAERVGGGRLPRVEIVDTSRERHIRSGSAYELPSIGERLAGALERTLAGDGQAVLLMNRRGWACALVCPRSACGWKLACEECDAAMVLHRGDQFPTGAVVRCHHCLAERVVPRLCPTCGNKVIMLGIGGQRVEEELSARFGLTSGSTLLRIDSDTMRSARDYFDALDRFRRGEVRVLLGTQMIAKGLDFPGVRLVGVVSADTALELPDFRAGERTFQLVSQVAGRAGRASDDGLVIVQTLNPDDPAILAAARHDYEGFAQRELSARSRSGLPPATRMARIVCRDPVSRKSEQRAREIERALRAFESLRVTGAVPCPISRIAGQYRHEVLAIAPGAGQLIEALSALRARGMIKSDAHTAVDVDPVGML
ncbi:MAG: primosomal protein N' [Phycisphaeraceae bacterium]|nr:primosomal protein N' [Phycisphaeraceae bacterium]